jgi:hypothetical protein
MQCAAIAKLKRFVVTVEAYTCLSTSFDSFDYHTQVLSEETSQGLTKYIEAQLLVNGTGSSNVQEES